LQALPDCLSHIGAGGGIEQTLVGLGVLYDGLSFTSYCQDQWAFALSKVSDEVAGLAPEGR
jgi:hypothetical protein